MVSITFYAVSKRNPITFQKLDNLPTLSQNFTKTNVWDAIPSYPNAVRSCSLAPAALPVTQVSVERLFSAMRLLLLGMQSWIKQDAVETILCTNMI